MAHMAPRHVVNPNRLFAAADLLLNAIRSPRGGDSQISMYVGPLRVGGWLPPKVFTSEELYEAMSMLMRMGLVPAGAPCTTNPD